MRDAAHVAVERAARHSYGRLLAVLARTTGNIAAAEDALSDALASALKTWAVSGVPDAPDAWLITVARRRAVDRIRHERTAANHTGTLTLLTEERGVADEPSDARLNLLFVCAHEAIDRDMHAPLMLQTVLGLTAAQIAPLFLLRPATLSQQLVRAKTKIAKAGIRFDLPTPSRWTDRLPSVLDAIYAAFAAGATARDEAMMEEALYLVELCVSQLPEEPEAKGLLALCLYTLARFGADRDEDGRFVPLSAQDIHGWRISLIDRAEIALHDAGKHKRFGRYQLEAAIQSAHCHQKRTGTPQWPAILHLYKTLSIVAPSVGATVGHAAALHGASLSETALDLLDTIAVKCEDYQPYWATRAAVLAAIGQRTEAEAAYTRAAELSDDPATRQWLTAQKQKSDPATAI
ncbi:RNA polymerase sigma factor [Parvularcula sp. LCG005]|uniref:RNA polymerase sigma factor n=1 Tax=Parvularcula sp. LCG005 TaxID=3078805 RepID=UPI002942E1A3|nr:DUF6596 domain-containing protein [Parvularcula sp. LCG005]WOI52466.1 DUF6596 domain-containing protein [Parvularcula sp. LCG005]